MSELSVDDLNEKKAKRDSEGNLVGNTHEIDWYGETKHVRTKPITTGLLNELSELDDGINNLEPEAVHEAIQTLYLTESIRNLTVQDISDLEAGALKRLLQPLEDEVDAEFGEVDENPSPKRNGSTA
jgi:hypothetical protein